MEKGIGNTIVLHCRAKNSHTHFNVEVKLEFCMMEIRQNINKIMLKKIVLEKKDQTDCNIKIP